MRLSARLSALVALSVHVAQGKVYDSLSEHSAATEKQYDFIVVGGGVAGSVLASRLSENPTYNVLLVEAGQNDEGVEVLQVPGFTYSGLIDESFYWGTETVPMEGLGNRTMGFTRGHVLGGGSSINGMVYTRGAEDDFDLWERVSGDKGWSWKGLLPYLKRAEKFVPHEHRDVEGQYDPDTHGYEGRTIVTLPWAKSSEHYERTLNNARAQPEFAYNVDANNGKPVGLTWMQSTIGNGERQSASATYLDQKTRQRHNLDILLNTYATRVLPVRKGKGLDLRSIELVPRKRDGTALDEKRTTITASKEVLLTAGAFGSPQILLNSGIGDKKDLDAVGVTTILNNPDVGKDLTDHMNFGLTWSGTWSTPPPVDREAALQEWRAKRTGPLVDLVGQQILWARIPSNSSIWEKYEDPAPGPTSPHFELTIGADASFAYLVLLTPHSRGSIKIRSNNPTDPPLVDLGFLTHPFDVAAWKEGIRLARRFYSGPAWAGYVTAYTGPDPDLLSDADFVKAISAGAGSFYHPAGVTPISPRGSKRGVLDPDLRVKGARGLRVVDAGIMPYVPTAHTQAAVYAIAERASDLIKKDWRKSVHGN